MSLEDEAQGTLDRGELAEQRELPTWDGHTPQYDDEGGLDEQRLHRQSELVAILRKHKVATVALYKGEGLFARKAGAWIISDYRPGGRGGPGPSGEMTEPELEIFGIALCGDGICYAFRRPGKQRRRGGYVYGRRLMMGPTKPLPQHTQQEIAIKARCGTFENDCWQTGPRWRPWA